MHVIDLAAPTRPLKPIFHWKTGPNANEIDTKKSEMYMANAQILHWDPMQPIFYWLAFGFRVG